MLQVLSEDTVCIRVEQINKEGPHISILGIHKTLYIFD